MQKILITGASGFVGGFLVDEALSRSLDVYAAIRKTSNIQYLNDPRINFVYIDFEDIEELAKLFQEHQFDYIVHNAGLTKSLKAEQYFKVNSEYLQNMITALSKSGSTPSKLTFISSLASYGPADYTENGILTESSTPHPVTNYGKSKLDAEIYLKSQSIVNYTIIRPTAVYGPREKDLFTVYDLINKGLEMTIGMTDQKLTFIYVKDLTRVILDATLADKRNVAYFVTDLNVQTSTSYNNAIKEALGRKRTVKLRLPILLVKTLGYVAEQYGKLTNSYPALNTEKVNELEAKSWICDTTTLEKDLNFVPQYNIHEGLRESIMWYKKNNWIK